MKKSFAALIAMFVVFFACIGTVSAESAPSKMYQAVNKQLKQGHYDYDNGSLKLTHVKTIHLQKPVNKVKTLTLGIANYKTVRDNIFFANHHDAVYFDPHSNQMVSIQTALKINAVGKYQNQYKNIIGEHVQISIIFLLLFFVLLVPAYFAYVWAKRRYSVLTYKLKNNLFDGTGENKYS